MTAICLMHMKYFPFDTQTCDLNFGIWNSDTTSQKLINQSFTQDPFAISDSLWDFVDLRSLQNDYEYGSFDGLTLGTYSSVIFRLTMKRKSMYYVVNFIVPCVGISVLNFGVFILPVDSPDRITLGTAIFLSYTVFLLVIHSELPTTSEYFPLISFYLVGLVITSGLSILMNILISNMYNTKGKMVPVCVRKMLNSGGESGSEQAPQVKSDKQWTTFVKQIDRIVFVLFILAQMMVTFSYLGPCLANAQETNEKYML